MLSIRRSFRRSPIHIAATLAAGLALAIATTPARAAGSLECALTIGGTRSVTGSLALDDVTADRLQLIKTRYGGDVRVERRGSELEVELELVREYAGPGSTEMEFSRERGPAKAGQTFGPVTVTNARLDCTVR